MHKYSLTPSGRFTRERLTANGRAVGELNQKLQREQVIGGMGWGRWALQIPENEYQRVLLQNPELSCWDKDIRTRAWNKLMNSDRARAWRVREKC